MREILFRGKSREEHNKGEWVHGYYGLEPNESGVVMFVPTEKVYDCMDTLWEVEVYPETVGQDTGLTDKNGMVIFEGDITLHVWQGGINNERNTIQSKINRNKRVGLWQLCTIFER